MYSKASSVKARHLPLFFPKIFSPILRYYFFYINFKSYLETCQISPSIRAIIAKPKMILFLKNLGFLCK